MSTNTSKDSPQYKHRAQPGSKGGGKFYRIVVRPKGEFISFRTHDVGEAGHIERVAGLRSSGSWDTQAWLIGKDDAHVKGGHLVADNPDVQEVLNSLGSKPKHAKGDIFRAKDRPNVAEKDKPTAAQKKARAVNIKKAQAARRARPSK